MRTLTAVVPVRGGSRRLRDKNLAPFAGTTLLEFKLDQLLRTDGVDQVVVSSDSQRMLDVARAMGVATHRRAPEFCDDVTRTFPEVVEHVAESVTGDDLLWAFCTAPLVLAPLYDRAIVAYREALERDYDSLVSVEAFKQHLWDETGPVNYSSGRGHVLSQDLPPFVTMTEGIFLAAREDMVRWKYFHGPNPFRFEIDKWSSIDINDELDLACAQAWFDLRAGASHMDAGHPG